MFGPPQKTDGVLVGNDIVGTRVTRPEDVIGVPGEGVHVGGKAHGVNGSAGPRGCEANAL